jgi:hypothetical protein
MVMISFVSKDNEGNQNLLAKHRQAESSKFSYDTEQMWEGACPRLMSISYKDVG